MLHVKKEKPRKKNIVHVTLTLVHTQQHICCMYAYIHAWYVTMRVLFNATHTQLHVTHNTLPTYRVCASYCVLVTHTLHASVLFCPCDTYVCMSGVSSTWCHSTCVRQVSQTIQVSVFQNGVKEACKALLTCSRVKKTYFPSCPLHNTCVH